MATMELRVTAREARRHAGGVDWVTEVDGRVVDSFMLTRSQLVTHVRTERPELTMDEVMAVVDRYLSGPVPVAPATVQEFVSGKGPRTLFVSSVVLLTEREIGAGTDLPSGAPALVLEGLRALGIDAPNQRYLLTPEAAIRVGSALLAAADPTLVPALLKLAVAERSPPPPGGYSEADRYKEMQQAHREHLEKVEAEFDGR